MAAKTFEIRAKLPTGHHVTYTEVAENADKALDQWKARVNWTAQRRRNRAGAEILAVVPVV